jgi:hypothetical protein
MRKWFLIIAIILVMLIISISCIQAHPPAPSPASVPQTTPKSTPSTPTPTLPPSSVPSSISLPLQTIPPEIKQGLFIISHSEYIDSLGHFRVIGEVQNNGTQATQSNKVRATFYDSQGVVVIESSNYCYLEVLQPGEISPFEIIFASVPISKQYKLFATGDSTNIQPYRGITLKDITNQIQDDGSRIIAGIVVNTGIEVSKIIAVTGSFYDNQHKIIAVGYTFCSNTDVKPGGTSDFAMSVDPNVASLISSYSLQAEGYKK